MAQVCTLVVVSIMVVQAMSQNNESSCTNYLSTCNPQNQATCCMFPIVLCLPDNKGSSSCLSPLDVASLSPSITNSAKYSNFVATLKNVTMSLMNLAPNNLSPPTFYGRQG